MKKLCMILLCVAMMLSMMASFAGCDQEKEEKSVVTTKELRIGILSDIHTNTPPVYNPLERFEKALRFFQQKGVDGVMITGDLLDTYSLVGIEDIQSIWLDVFPNNTNPLTGEHVEPLFVYGNHDEGMVAQEVWFDELGEFEEAWIKEIKGYQFVGVHFSKEAGAEVQKLLEKAQEASTDKPFFFAQHVPTEGTVIGGYATYGGYEIPLQDALKRAYNCVVFTGHTHVPITDERAIWQSTSKKAAQCTVVTCGTLHYAHLQDFCQLEINGDKHQTQQGLYMVVDGSQVTLERYSFTDMELEYVDGVGTINIDDAKVIGVPWTFDAMDKKDRPYDYSKREQKAFAPVFPEGATPEVSELTATSAAITVPAASVEAPEGFSDLVQSYYAEVTDTATGELVATVEVAAPYHIDTEAEHLNQPVTLYVTELTPNTEYSLLIYARECYQKASEPISITITTTAE